eukprot:Nk52_evm11s2596 gene=Nk52_evmTU11s2596
MARNQSKKKNKKHGSVPPRTLSILKRFANKMPVSTSEKARVYVPEKSYDAEDEDLKECFSAPQDGGGGEVCEEAFPKRKCLNDIRPATIPNENSNPVAVFTDDEDSEAARTPFSNIVRKDSDDIQDSDLEEGEGKENFGVSNLNERFAYNNNKPSNATNEKRQAKSVSKGSKKSSGKKTGRQKIEEKPMDVFSFISFKSKSKKEADTDNVKQEETEIEALEKQEGAKEVKEEDPKQPKLFSFFKSSGPTPLKVEPVGGKKSNSSKGNDAVEEVKVVEKPESPPPSYDHLPPCQTYNCKCLHYTPKDPDFYHTCTKCKHHKTAHRVKTAEDETVHEALKAVQECSCIDDACTCDGFVPPSGANNRIRSNHGLLTLDDLPGTHCNSCNHPFKHHRQLTPKEVEISSVLEEAYGRKCGEHAGSKLQESVRVKQKQKLCVKEELFRPLAVQSESTAVDCTVCVCDGFGRGCFVALLELSQRSPELSIEEMKDQVSCPTCTHPLSSHREKNSRFRDEVDLLGWTKPLEHVGEVHSIHKRFINSEHCLCILSLSCVDGDVEMPIYGILTTSVNEANDLFVGLRLSGEIPSKRCAFTVRDIVDDSDKVREIFARPKQQLIPLVCVTEISKSVCTSVKTLRDGKLLCVFENSSFYVIDPLFKYRKNTCKPPEIEPINVCEQEQSAKNGIPSVVVLDTPERNKCQSQEQINQHSPGSHTLRRSSRVRKTLTRFCYDEQPAIDDEPYEFKDEPEDKIEFPKKRKLPAENDEIISLEDHFALYGDVEIANCKSVITKIDENILKLFECEENDILEISIAEMIFIEDTKEEICFWTAHHGGSVCLWRMDPPIRGPENSKHSSTVVDLEATEVSNVSKIRPILKCQTESFVTCISTHPTLPFLCFGTEKGTVEIRHCDIKNLDSCPNIPLIGTAHSTYGSIYCCEWHPEEKVFVFGGEDDLLTVCKLTEKRPVEESSKSKDKLSGLMSYFTKLLPLCETMEVETISRLEFHSSFVSSLCFSSNGKLLFTGGWDGCVGVWKVEGLNKELCISLCVDNSFCVRRDVVIQRCRWLPCDTLAVDSLGKKKSLTTCYYKLKV